MQFDCYKYNYALIALKCMRLPTNHIALVLGDISIISKYRDINQHDNHIVRKMLLTILSKDR